MFMTRSPDRRDQAERNIGRVSLKLHWHSSFWPKGTIFSLSFKFILLVIFVVQVAHSNHWQRISRLWLHSLLHFFHVLFGKEHIICFLFALQQKCCRKRPRKKTNLPWIDVRIASLIWRIISHARNWSFKKLSLLFSIVFLLPRSLFVNTCFWKQDGDKSLSRVPVFSLF